MTTATEVWAQTIGMECHARLPSGRFTVAEDAAENGILLGGGVEIAPCDAMWLQRGRYLIVAAAWGAYTSAPGHEGRYVRLTVERQ